MIKVSTSLPDIAVLRGGTADFKQSLKEGAEILQSLVKLGYHPLDVLIDTEGHWTAKGAPTDAHQIYVRAHTVIDTTRMKGEAYQDLAKRMGIPLLFSRAHEVTMDREDMYRILRQQGIKVPETTVIRAKSPLKAEQLRSIWSTYHTPLMIRPLKRVEGVPSKLIHGYHDLENTIRIYHDKGVDMHVLTYRKVPTASVALVPQFRNEKLYMPLWVETFTSMHEIPNNASRMQTYTRAPDFRKDQMKQFVTKAYEALGLTGPVCIDVISYNDTYSIVNIDTAPSLRKEGRFMRSLETTGADAGEYVHSCIQDSLLHHELPR